VSEVFLKTVRLVAPAALVAVVLAVVPPVSTGQVRTQQRDQVQQRTHQREIIPGSELMTSAEREDYRQRYAAAKTDEGREKVRAGHIKDMEERARMRGLQLVPQPAPKGGAR
jgi:hypothetical protein